MVIFKRCETATPNAYQVCQKFFEMLFNCRSKKIEDAFFEQQQHNLTKAFICKQNRTKNLRLLSLEDLDLLPKAL